MLAQSKGNLGLSEAGDTSDGSLARASDGGPGTTGMTTQPTGGPAFPFENADTQLEDKRVLKIHLHDQTRFCDR